MKEDKIPDIFTLKDVALQLSLSTSCVRTSILAAKIPVHKTPCGTWLVTPEQVFLLRAYRTKADNKINQQQVLNSNGSKQFSINDVITALRLYCRK